MNRQVTITYDDFLPKESEDLPDHRLVGFAMKDGLRYVLDFTSAQFGWFENVATWEQYYNTRVASFTDETEGRR